MSCRDCTYYYERRCYGVKPFRGHPPIAMLGTIPACGEGLPSHEPRRGEQFVYQGNRYYRIESYAD